MALTIVRQDEVAVGQTLHQRGSAEAVAAVVGEVGFADGVLWKVKVLAQSCPALCEPMDCSSPVSSIHGVLQARIWEWIALSFSRGSSQPRDRTQVSLIAGRFFII